MFDPGCPVTVSELVEARLDRLLTQYRESPNLQFLIRTYLSVAAQTGLQLCNLPGRFELNVAEGDQLTLIGKRLGWPRNHCSCNPLPVFGFSCSGEPAVRPLAGLWCSEDSLDSNKNSSWSDCVEGVATLSIEDDELYRRFLKVRLYQIQKRFDLKSLEECLAIFWGDDAFVIASGNGRVVVAPGRDLTDMELTYLPLYARVLPVAVGISTKFHLSTEISVLGFGEGWGSFCEDKGTSSSSGYPLSTEGGVDLVDEYDSTIDTGITTEDAIWLCEIDPQTYACST